MGGGVDPAGLPKQIGLELTADGLATGDDPAVDLPVPATTQSSPAPSASDPTASQPAPSRPLAAEAGDARVAVSQDAAQWLDATCPYLRSTDGTWRSVVPQRGQRCWGQTPPAPLEPVTQERLCRTEAHTRCEIYVAAEQRHLDSLARDHVAPERLDGRFGVLVRPSTLVLDESGPARVQMPVRVSAARRTRVAVGLGLAGVVVLVALLAGLVGGAAPVSTQPPPIAYATPSPAASAASTVTTAPLPSQTTAPPTQVAATPVVTPTPTQAPGPSHSPGIRTTYRVHKGDTLAMIAAKFGVTKKQLLAVNDFGNPPHLRYGFLINIPYP